MFVLGIETSCDETSASIVKDGRLVLSNIITSSVSLHKKYGGIIPEIAFRMQLETIAEVVDCAVKKAKIQKRDIDLISVTEGPGLLGSLLIGISFAKATSLALRIPLLGVNHLDAHIYANFLNDKVPGFPFLALVVSGGHTSLFFVKDFHAIEMLGSTQDDACGEAFDKVAKILGLGYPGGPIIEQLSKKGNPKKIKFGCSNTKNPLDFSFSGIKTAVFYHTKKVKSDCVADICASFQETVVNTLIEKSLRACKIKNARSIVVAGGVASNNRLREKFYEASKENGYACFFPGKDLCTDNAAMIAGLGFQLFMKNKISSLNLTAELN